MYECAEKKLKCSGKIQYFLKMVPAYGSSVVKENKVCRLCL